MARPKLPPLVIPWLGDTSGFERSTAAVKGMVKSLTSSFSRGVTNNLNATEKQAHRTNKSFKQLEKTVGNVGKHTANVGRGMRSGGFQASYLISAPIIAMMRKGSREIIDYEANLTTLASKFGVMPKAAQTSAQSMGSYSKFLQSQAANSVQSISELSNAAIVLARGGVKQERSKWMLEPIRMLSTIERQSAANTATQLKAMATVFDIKETKAGYAEFADMIAYTTTNTAFDLKGLAAGVIKAGGTAKAYGQTARESLSTLGLFADLGVKGGSTGVAAQNFMTYLLASTKESGSMKKKLGIGREDLEDPTTGKAKPVHEVMKTIIESFQKDGATDMTRLSALLTIFKRRSLGPIAAALNTMTDSEGKETINNAFRRFLAREKRTNGVSQMGIAQTGLAKKQETLMEGTAWAKSGKMTSAITNMYIAFGSAGALESITAIIEDITAGVTAVSQLKPSTLSAILKTAVGLAALGPMLIIASSAVSLLSIGIKGLGIALAAANFIALNGLIPTIGLYTGMVVEALGITAISATGLTMVLAPLVAIGGFMAAMAVTLWLAGDAMKWYKDNFPDGSFIHDFAEDWLMGIESFKNGTWSLTGILDGLVLSIEDALTRLGGWIGGGVGNVVASVSEDNDTTGAKWKGGTTTVDSIMKAKQGKDGATALHTLNTMKGALGININNNTNSDISVEGSGFYAGENLVTKTNNGATMQGGQ